MSKPIKTRRLFELDVYSGSLESLADYICTQIKKDQSCRIVALNTNKLYQMKSQNRLRKSMNHADVVIPDGMSIVWASQILPGDPLQERVTGIDLFLELIRRCEMNGFRPFFFGARETVLETMLENLNKDFPDLEIAGARSGYFEEKELPEIVRQINDAEAEMLFIGISSPIKEQIMEQFGDNLDVPIIQGVGGSFDVVAGKVDRAPDWMQAVGLEWFYRLSKEPGRLWKRYLLANSYFLWRLVKEYFRGSD